MALMVLSIAAMALLFGFATSITASVEHRNLASLDASTRVAANEAIADVQQQAQLAAGTSNDPFVCPTTFVPTFTNLTGSFTVATPPPVQYWNGSSFGGSCIPYAPQQYTLTVSSGTYSTSVDAVVYYPGAPPSPNGVGQPTQLVWIQQPISGTTGTPIAPQPEVAVEDGSGNIVTSDFSSVTLQVVSGPGSFSNTCSGVESYGVVTFSNCSLNTAGSYSIQAVDASPGVTATPAIPVSVNAAPPAKLAFTSNPSTANASQSANLGPVTVQEQDAFGNPITTGVAVTVNLTSSSTGSYVFGAQNATTPTGPKSVTIPAGQSSVTFYYGDTKAGSPTLTASVSGLAPDTLSETIKALTTVSKLGFTNSPFTAGASNSATAQFTVALEDTFGNPTTKATSTTVNLASSSGTGKFASSSGGASITTVTIPANTTSVNAFYGDPTNGTPTITASVTGQPTWTATQTETITSAATKLVFTSAPVTGNAYTDANLGPITVTEEDGGGNPTTVGETVNLSSNSTGTYIFNGTQGATTPTGATSVTIPAGQSSVTFYYGDTKAGTPTITAAATGLTSATQKETINVGPLAAFAPSNPGTQTAGQAFSETITAVDAGGNTVTSYGGAGGTTYCFTFSGPANSPNNTAPKYPVQGTCPSGSAVTFTNGVADGLDHPLRRSDHVPPGNVRLDHGDVTQLHGERSGDIGVLTGHPCLPHGRPGLPRADHGDRPLRKHDQLRRGGRDKLLPHLQRSGQRTERPSARIPRGNTCAAGQSQVKFTSGSATPSITLYDAQTTTLTASQGTITGTSAAFTVSAAGLGTLSVANPGQQVAGVPFNVTVTAGDAYRNPISGTIPTTFGGPHTSPGGTQPSYPSSLTVTNGQAIGSVTLYDAESTTLQVVSGGVTGTSTSFTVIANVAQTLTATSGANQSATVNTAFASKLVATATDAYGNAVSGLSITFSAPPSGASANFAATCSANPQTYSCRQNTGANGQATSSTFTASATNGTYNITATAGALTATYAETNKGNQTSSFTSTAPAGAKVGGATYTPTASATSGLPVTITVDATTSANCSISGGVVSFTGAGNCTLDANQSGNAIWNAAAQVQQTFAVAKGTQAISFTSTAPGSAGVGGATYTAIATASPSGLTVTFSSGSTGVCTSGGTNGSVFTFVGTGTCIVNANQAGNANWNAAAQVQQTFAVAKGSQVITFTSSAPGSAQVGGATYTPVATSNSGLPVTITVDALSTGICSISGGVVSFTTPGTCTLDANQVGNANWNAATQVQQGFAVGKGTQVLTYTSTAPAAAKVGGATYTPTATSNSGLPVTITVDATTSANCSISGGVVSFTAAGTCTLDANQAGNANWNAATQLQQSFAVGKGTQTLSFTSTAPGSAVVSGATYTPTASATSGLPVTITVDATTSANCSISGGVVSFTGAGNCTLDANQAGNANWNAAAQVQQTFAVAKGSQTVSFTSTAPAGAKVGGATYTPTASATSGLGATITVDATTSANCSISGGVVSFTGAGNCTLDANQAGNANWNAAAQVQQTFAVAKGSQVITFTSSAPGSAQVGGATYTPVATSNSGLPVTITVDALSTGICSISGGVVSFTTPGTCTLDANQVGNANWNAATQVQQGFAVGKGTQVLTYTSTAPAAAKVGGATYTPTATSNSGLPVTITVDATTSANCSISGGVVSFTAAGTCTLDANQAGNANWNAATQLQQSFAVGKGTQTLSFTSTAPGSAVVSGATYTPTASATSGLPVTITVDATTSANCSISGGVVSFTGAGNCTLDANQAGNANWNAAAQVQQTFAVAKGSQTVSFTSTAPAGAKVGGATYTPTASATSGLGATITVDATTSANCSISGGVVSFTGAGNCTLDANQAGNANWNAAAQVQQTFAVAKGSQVITFTSSAPGSAQVGGATYTPVATSNSGLPVTITVDALSTGICSISGGVVSFTTPGTCTLDANQVGNANWNAATQVQQGFAVGKGTQVLTYTSTAPAGAVVGGATYTAAATATSGLTVTFTSGSAGVCTSGGTNGSVFTFVGAGTCIVNANQAGNPNWNAAPQLQQTFAVTPLTITDFQYSGTGPKVTFSGTGATGASSVTVTVCSVNSFPCSGPNTRATATTAASPSNPWTTAATSASLTYGTTYYAQAVQGAHTSAVFTFTPTQPTPTAVALANGGTAARVDTGDTATVTFNEQLDASTICSAWTNTGAQTVTDATITYTNGTTDTFAATSASCSGAGNFGTVSTANYVLNTVTFTNSTITWDPANDTLTFTFGTRTSGVIRTGVLSGRPGYTLNSAVTDLNGIPANTTTFTSGINSGF